MKKLLFIYTILLLFFSCTTGVDDVFEQPASERLSETLNECRELLTSATNGWLIQYFPSSTQQFGGYNFVAKFNADGFVEVAGEMADNLGYDISETITSHFSLNTSSSVMLTFDTYNKYLHYFSDPDDYADNKYEGDFEFVYVSGNDEEMIFKGGKTENTITFTAIKDDEDWIERLRNIVAQRKKVEDLFYADYLWLDEAGNAIELQQDGEFNTLIYYPDSNDTSTTELVPYIFTDNGIRFYKPETFHGVTVQYFEWNETRKAYVSAGASDAAGMPASVLLSGSKSKSFIAYDDLIGHWNLIFYNGETSQRVLITEKEKGKTLLMSGLGYDVTLNYHKLGLYVSLSAQPVYGDYIILCPWDAYLGYYTWSAGIGMNFVLNTNATTTELLAEDNGAWGDYKANSFLFADFSGSEINILTQIPLITKLSK